MATLSILGVLQNIILLHSIDLPAVNKKSHFGKFV